MAKLFRVTAVAVMVAALATVGEVCNALREVWGVYHPTEFF